MTFEVVNHKVRICGKNLYVAKVLRKNEDGNGYLEFLPIRYGVVDIYGIPNAKLTKMDIYYVIVPSEESNLYYIKIGARHWSIEIENAEDTRISCEIGYLISGKEVTIKGRYYASRENHYFKFVLTKELEIIELPPDDVMRL